MRHALHALHTPHHCTLRAHFARYTHCGQFAHYTRHTHCARAHDRSFAVANALPLLTPQLFIGDKRVCDEDTDLGLEFTVDRMLQGQSAAPTPSRRRR